eukprot:23425-Ditylum_brightwellii.AAC.1
MWHNEQHAVEIVMPLYALGVHDEGEVRIKGFGQWRWYGAAGCCIPCVLLGEREENICCVCLMEKETLCLWCLRRQGFDMALLRFVDLSKRGSEK